MWAFGGKQYALLASKVSFLLYHWGCAKVSNPGVHSDRFAVSSCAGEEVNQCTVNVCVCNTGVQNHSSTL